MLASANGSSHARIYSLMRDVRPEQKGAAHMLRQGRLVGEAVLRGCQPYVGRRLQRVRRRCYRCAMKAEADAKRSSSRRRGDAYR